MDPTAYLRAKVVSRLLVTSVVVCIGLVQPREVRSAEQVIPDKIDVFLLPEGREQFTLKALLSDPPPSREPLDILFLFDSTASMENIARAVRQAAREIMVSLSRVSTNVRFSVGSFGDYPAFGDADGYPWRLNQDFTSDSDLIQHALDGLQAQSGGDIPEAVTRGLYESHFLSWRPDARRFLILFGDAPGHEPDPGRDGISGTADDLRLDDVIAQLKEKKITVISVFDTTQGPSKALLSDAIREFQLLAGATGGVTKPVSSVSEIPNAISAGIREAYRPVVRVNIPDSFRSWTTLSNGETIASGSSAVFDLSLSPPGGTASGVYRFPLTVVYAGEENRGEIGRSNVTIRVGFSSYPWRRLLFPFYGIFLTGLIGISLVSAYRKKINRYEFNGVWLGLLGRVLLAVLIFWVLYSLRIQGDDTPTNWNSFGRVFSSLPYSNKLQKPLLYSKGS